MEKCLLGDTIATSCTLDSISVAGGSTSEALKAFAGRVDVLHGGAVSAVIESMTGARFAHDTLECCGWHVEVADAQKVKGLARLACKTDRIDSYAGGVPARGPPTMVSELDEWFHVEKLRLAPLTR